MVFFLIVKLLRFGRERDKEENESKIGRRIYSEVQKVVFEQLDLYKEKVEKYVNKKLGEKIVKNIIIFFFCLINGLYKKKLFI